MEGLPLNRKEVPREGLEPEVTITKEEIEELLEDENIQAGEILRVFSKDFSDLYDAQAGTIEGYGLGEHTKMVLRQFLKYFTKAELPQVSKAFFLTFLALHDIGKPFASQDDDLDKQYEYTSKMLEHILEKMGFSAHEIAIAQSLVDGDPIRRYFYKRENIDDVAAEIVRKAGEAHLSVEDFWELLLTFWKSDAGSYTADAGGKASLDRMFEFEPDQGEMYLAPHIEERINTLKEAVLSLGAEQKEA